MEVLEYLKQQAAKGGVARAQKLTKTERSAIAKKAAAASAKVRTKNARAKKATKSAAKKKGTN